MYPMKRLERALVAAVASQKPNVPEAGRLLWSVFVNLSNARTYHAAGANPIGFAEIDAYMRLHRLPLQPHHIAIVRAMDSAWLDDQHKKAHGGSGPDGVPSMPHVSAQELTPELLDLMFG